MPIFCINCGAPITEGKKFCTVCGTKADDVTRPAPVQQQQAFTAPPPAMPQSTPMPPPAMPSPVMPQNYAAPAYNSSAAPPKDSKYAPMSTLGYIGWMILMNLPLAGLVIAIILAVGKGGPVNRRNLARAMLVFLGIGIAVAVYIFLVIWPVLSQFIEIDFGI